MWLYTSSGGLNPLRGPLAALAALSGCYALAPCTATDQLLILRRGLRGRRGRKKAKRPNLCRLRVLCVLCAELAVLSLISRLPLMRPVLISVAIVLGFSHTAFAQMPSGAELQRRVDAIMPKVVAWRRDIHEHPELGNRETRTAKIVADHLRALGIEVQTGVAHTGVVGVLRGGRPGPVVALRADMDALPVTERVNLPFASKAKATYNGAEVGVMHACGHDSHVAILMGVAEVLASMKNELPGTVKFVFQPAEEGPPQGEEGGAKLMVKEGVLTNPTVDAAFALHISAKQEVNGIYYKPGGTYASSDD